MKKSVALLFSGGQDSATVLMALLHAPEIETVHTLGFAYGQRHAVELDIRDEFLKRIEQQYPNLSKKLGEDRIIGVPDLGNITESALTQPDIEVKNTYESLPNTFVPGRNILFLTLAAAWGHSLGVTELHSGVSQQDYSGYPDCRSETLDSLEHTLHLAGFAPNLKIVSMLAHTSKAEEWSILEGLGGSALVTFVKDGTHTCYNGDASTHNDWGYGCGACPACKLREAGWDAFVGAKLNNPGWVA